jgi:hypothetical protein
MIPGSVILDLRFVTSDLYLLCSNLLPGVKELIVFLDFSSLLVKPVQTQESRSKRQQELIGNSMHGEVI